MWVKGELFDDFDAAAQAARGELDRDNQAILFDRLDWFRSVWAHCPPGGAPLIARARADQTSVWLFLARTDANTATSLSSWYTLSYRPIFVGEADENTKKALLIAVARRLATGLSTIHLSPVPENDGSHELIAAAFKKAGWIIETTPKTGNWTTQIGDQDFAAFWAARPGQVRSTHDRKSKKFDIKIDIHTHYNDAAWEDYELIYADSWKGEEGSPEFIHELAKTESAAGSLRLGIASYEGEPVAAQLWTCENGVAIIHKLAYREAAKDMSVGTILSAALFRHVIDQDKIHTIDYGTGDEPYKADWMDNRQQLYTLSLYNPKKLSGFFGAAKSGLSNILKRK
jgi:hypothetical protein